LSHRRIHPGIPLALAALLVCAAYSLAGPLGVSLGCLAVTLLILAALARERRRTAAALRELRVLAAHLLQAQEGERRRIARELHDDLNQSLALLSVELELLGRGAPGSAAQLQERVRGLADRVRELSSDVHRLSHRLHPGKLEQLGLVAAVGSLCRELALAHAIQIDFIQEPAVRSVPLETALCLYRIVQEALRNVVKHSGARHAQVELTESTEAVCLRITDTGAGFDPAAVNGNSGLGLLSIRERLRLVGGEVAIHSRPSEGTRIDVRVPLPPLVSGNNASLMECSS
jgi:signal transduction histidine kinase